MSDDAPIQPTPCRVPSAAPVPPAPVESLDELPACPVCGGHLVEIRQKWVCERCHTICQTCCEGGRG